MHAVVLAFHLWAGAEAIRVDVEHSYPWFVLALMNQKQLKAHRVDILDAYHAALVRPWPDTSAEQRELRDLWDGQRPLGAPDLNARSLGFNLAAGAYTVYLDQTSASHYKKSREKVRNFMVGRAHPAITYRHFICGFEIQALAHEEILEEAERVAKAEAELRGVWDVTNAGAAIPVKQVIFAWIKVATILRDDTKKWSEFTVYPGTKPARIDIGLDGDKVLGIYEVTGDSLKLCLAAAGQERPTQFQAGDGTIMMILKRAKK